MVKLTEVEDEHFAEKPASTKDNSLLADDDDDDYTDTGINSPSRFGGIKAYFSAASKSPITHSFCGVATLRNNH